MLSIVHAFATVLLLVARIYHFRTSHKDPELIKVDVLFTSLPVVTLVIYVTGLFRAKSTFYACSYMQDRSMLFDWIKVELIAFFSSVIGIALFMLVKAVMSRFYKGIKFSM